MKKSIIITIAIALTLSSWLVAAGSITDTYTSGDILTATKMNNIKNAVNDNNLKIVPIALASIASDGTKRTRSSNVSSSLSGTTYIISITGETYSTANYITNVTPVSLERFCRVSSFSGSLQVNCFTAAGTDATAAFHFVVYKIALPLSIVIPLTPVLDPPIVIQQ